MSLNGIQENAGAELNIDSLTKKYGSFVALEDVSLDIKPGEFVTLLGASGSGKTTLLRIVAGFLQPNSGTVLLDHQDITRVPVHKRNMGMVFQNYALFPHMNVEKNVSFPLEMRKIAKADRRALIDEALEAVHMGAFKNRLPKELSGGQQQRVALARAIVAKPGILLMDEPLGALDRRLRESMQIEILKLSRELGLTVVNVTHDQEEAFTMSDRIALLSQGKLVQFSSPAEMYEKPASSLVAEFVGESNVFRSESPFQGERSIALQGSGWKIDAADDAQRLASGDIPVVIVRPWGISLSSPKRQDVVSLHGQGESTFEGEISAVIYAGESRKIILHNTEKDRELIVRQPIEADFDFSEGSRVIAHWPAKSNVITRAHN